MALCLSQNVLAVACFVWWIMQRYSISNDTKQTGAVNHQHPRFTCLKWFIKSLKSLWVFEFYVLFVHSVVHRTTNYFVNKVLPKKNPNWIHCIVEMIAVLNQSFCHCGLRLQKLIAWPSHILYIRCLSGHRSQVNTSHKLDQ